MAGPDFTVVVPTHRRPSLLREALASVAAQTLPPAQVVVVDDAGDDETRAVVSAFPGVEYALNDRARGGSGARNAGAAVARGDWLAFLDDDDLWLPRKLERVAAVIAAGPADLGLVYSASEQFDGATGATLSRSRPQARGRVLDEMLYRNAVGGMSVVVVRRDLFEAVGGMDESFPSLQDMELYVRLAERASFDFADEVLVRFRVADHGRITFDPAKKLAGARMFAAKYRGLLDARPRHRHRAAARTFLFALSAGDYGEALRSAPWAAAGLVVDPGGFGYVVRGVASRARAALSGRAQGAPAGS
ncbi:MAG TPA: glycosyltransferase family 2 protein [Trueperaceae bacterium]|nr:glycosyltransferase family 2 protein [Trueperaceae bacterium]